MTRRFAAQRWLLDTTIRGAGEVELTGQREFSFASPLTRERGAGLLEDNTSKKGTQQWC